MRVLSASVLLSHLKLTLSLPCVEKESPTGPSPTIRPTRRKKPARKHRRSTRVSCLTRWRIRSSGNRPKASVKLVYSRSIGQENRLDLARSPLHVSFFSLSKEKAWIEVMCRDKDAHDAEIFRKSVKGSSLSDIHSRKEPHADEFVCFRIYPYFNGKTSVQEMCYREDLSRKEISHVLKVFGNDVSSVWGMG